MGEAHLESGRPEEAVQAYAAVTSGPFVDAARRVTEARPGHFSEFLAFTGFAFTREAGRSEDYGARVLERGATAWAKLAHRVWQAGQIVARGQKPYGPLEHVRKLRDGAALDLPEVRSDLHLAYGRLLVACGEEEAAAAEFKKAGELAPDARRRAVAAAALQKK